MTAPNRKFDDAAAEQVVGFLRAHPSFLAERPELYRALHPPVRVHGEPFADHMAAMLRAERAHAAAMTERADGVLAAGRAAAGLAGRVQEAVLALFGASDPAECVALEFPGLLAVDAAVLCLEAVHPHVRTLPAGAIGHLLQGRDVRFRTAPEDAALLHAEAALLARFDALIRVPGSGPAALVALATRDEAMLEASQGQGALAFLGRAVAAALGR
ncbi:MAG: hypothetical protein JOY71_11150 [Acetobacteraceae bacterium]|nr:hypothetical protein [Acetobacteraceae bacterium]MBV8522660.1 hypothetical protein [Acetobacteraceae bacterium]MBV8590861.1 hypothetical protein [Acetobacteraceae bacterium]